jgi:metal-responsive CopG/Arc/MetJ family transcriptional regulator
VFDCPFSNTWLPFEGMTVQVNLPDELVSRIDEVATDRTAFVAEAVRRHLRSGFVPSVTNETARINELSDELNREAEDVLEYQVIS